LYTACGGKTGLVYMTEKCITVAQKWDGGIAESLQPVRIDTG
jgi:hypothetical protein